jgi:Ca2+-transporting ATPase
MSDDELGENIEKYSVFARVSPSDKVRIIKAWQSRGKNVTVTGDGVQDADALALADVGCAIGKFGADVAKGNADIIIQNNRFSSIVYAIKQSRALFSNVRKLVNYLFSTNFAEIFTVLFGMIFTGIMPVAAVHLLWINLLTDSAPAISLCMEGAEKGVMKSKRVFSNKIFDKYAVFSVTSQGMFIAILTLIVFAIGKTIGGLNTATTMAFAALGLMQIFHCFNNKFEGSIFNKEIFSNNLLNFSSAIAIFIILFLIFTPAGYVFGLEMLNIGNFALVLLFSILIIPFSELTKLIAKRI